MLSENQNALLQQLLMSEEYQPDSYFAKQLNVTERTIRNLLKSLEPYFVENQLTVDRQYGKGVRLHYRQHQENQVPNFGNNTSPSYRRERIKLFLLLNRQSKTSLNALSEIFFVTKNAIVEDLKKIEGELTPYRLVMEKNNQGTSLTGKRKNIKNAILDMAHRYGTEFIFNNSEDYRLISSIDQQIFTHDFSVKLREVLGKLTSVFNYQFNEDYYFSLLINLMIDSHLFGHMVEPTSETKQCDSLGEWFKYEFREVFGIAFKPSYNEERFAEYLEAFSLEPEREVSTEAFEYAEALVAFYSSIRQTQFQKKELVQHIALFISGFQLRQRYRIKVFNSQLDYLFTYYSEELLALRLSVDSLTNRFTSIESNDELGSLLFYFLGTDELSCQEEQVTVLSSHSVGINQHITRVMEEALPGISVTIQSTIPDGTGQVFQYKKGRRQCLDNGIEQLDIFNPRQLAELRQEYRQERLAREQELLQMKIANELRGEKMSHQLCQKADMLHHIANRLVDQGLVTPEFLPSLIRKEVFNPVALTSQKLGISVISHKHVLQNGFYAGFLPRTVQWTDKGIGQRVDSIFVLIIKEDNQDLAVKNLYQGILHGLKESLREQLV